MKQFNYHKSLDSISIYNLNKIRESIDNGNPDYRYMLKINHNDGFPKLNNKQKEILEIAYYDLMYEMPEVSMELISTYREYLEVYLKTKINKSHSELNSLKTDENIKISYSNLNRAFSEYLNSLHKQYTNFTITEYNICHDFKKIIKDEYPNINYRKEFELLKKEIQGFYSLPEYINEVDKLNIYESFRNLFKSDLFIENFIESKTIIIQDLNPYIERLRFNYQLFNDYEGYIELRHKLFSLNNMRFDSKHTYNFYDEVLNVKRVLGFDFDIRKISALEYLNYIKSIKAKMDNEKTKDKAV